MYATRVVSTALDQKTFIDFGAYVWRTLSVIAWPIVVEQLR